MERINITAYNRSQAFRFQFYIDGSKTTFDYFTNGYHALSHWINKKWFSQLFVEDYYLIYRLSAFK